MMMSMHEVGIIEIYKYNDIQTNSDWEFIEKSQATTAWLPQCQIILEFLNFGKLPPIKTM
jgi:hypothetical protein